MESSMSRGIRGRISGNVVQTGRAKTSYATIGHSLTGGDGAFILEN